MRRLCWLLFVALLPAGAARGVRVEYTVTVRPGAEDIRVAAALRDLPDGPLTVAMPVWIPGYYARTDQAEGVEGLTVTSNGAPLATERISPSLWRVENHPGSARVEYTAPAREYGYHADNPAPTLGHLGIYVDGDSAFLHPGAALVYALGHEGAPSTLRLDLPDGWSSTAPLPRNASGAFVAPDYHTLNDSPVQAGAFRRLAFTARGRAFEIVLTGAARVSEGVILDVCRRVAGAALDLFAPHIPFRRYQFHLHFPPDRIIPGAGLEHASATVIVFDNATDERAFRGAGARLIAHEFIHAWNAKALRPEGFLPMDYQNPPRTSSLWLVEGVTDYQAHLVMTRSGLWTAEEALEALAGHVDAYRASSGRYRTSLAVASEGVWDAPGSNGFGGTNYYTKGLLAAWTLDTEIRTATGGRKGLDGAMRLMLKTYAARGRPYPPDALPDAIEEACGVDVSRSYRAAIYGTEDLPLERAAERMGARLETRPRPDPMLGVAMRAGPDGPVVEAVLRGAARDAGLRAGDTLLTLDGDPVPKDGRPLLQGYEVDERVPMTIRRGPEEMAVSITVRSRPAASLERIDAPTPSQRAVWDGLWGRPDG